MQELIRQLRASEYARHIGWLVRGNILAQLLQLAALPFISRLYTPAEFGVLSLFVAFTGFATVALTLRYESAMLVVDDDDIAPTGQLSLVLIVVVASAAVAILYLLIGNAVLGHDILPAVSVPLMWVVLVGCGLFNIGRAMALRNGESRAIASARVIRAGSNVLTKIGLGFAGFSAVGLIAGELAGAWMASGKVKAGRLVLAAMRQFSWLKIRQVARRYSKFSMLELPSNLINQMAIALPVPMLASIGGAEAAGAYGIARLVVAIPNSQIGNAVADAFQLRIAELVRQREFREITAVLDRTFKSLLLVGLLPYLAIALFSPWAFPFVLGAQWQEAGSYAALISGWMYLALAVGSVSRLLSALQRQGLKLYYDVTSLALVTGVYFAALRYQWNAFWFLAGIVAVSMLAYLFYLILIYKAAADAGRSESTGEQSNGAR